MLKICLHQLRIAVKSPRLYLTILIGCVMQIVSVTPLLNYACAIDKPLCIFESFIYLNCDTYISTAIFLAVVILVSDIPFSSNNEIFSLIRISRKRWLFGKCLYILVICIIYYGVISICGALYVLGNAYVENTWSLPIQMLSIDTNGVQYTLYKAYFPYAHVLCLQPVFAFFICFLLSTLYAVLMSLVIFFMNLILKKKISFFLGIMFHILNYIFAAILPSLSFKRISLLANSLLMYHNIGDYYIGKQFTTIPKSVGILVSIIALLLFLLNCAAKKYDFVTVTGEKQ